MTKLQLWGVTKLVARGGWPAGMIKQMAFLDDQLVIPWMFKQGTYRDYQTAALRGEYSIRLLG